MTKKAPRKMAKPTRHNNNSAVVAKKLNIVPNFIIYIPPKLIGENKPPIIIKRP